MLKTMLDALDVSVKQTVYLRFDEVFRALWAANGDHVSRIHAGTGALEFKSKMTSLVVFFFDLYIFLVSCLPLSALESGLSGGTPRAFLLFSSARMDLKLSVLIAVVLDLLLTPEIFVFQFKDGAKSVTRTIQNNLMDSSKQEAIDRFLSSTGLDPDLQDQASNLLPPSLLGGGSHCQR